MNSSSRSLSRNQEIALAALALLIICTYIYTGFFVRTFLGFRYSSTIGRVYLVFVNPEVAAVKVGDLIRQIGPTSFAEHRQSSLDQTLQDYHAGDLLPLVIERDGKTINLDWVIPNPTWAEIRYQLSTSWWLSIIFWIVGTLALLMARPADIRRNLLVVLNYTIAIWLVASMSGAANTYYSRVIATICIWMIWPLYWHLNWVFPKPIGKLPAWSWGLLYTTAALIAVLVCTNVLPAQTNFYAILLAAIGGIVIILFHIFLKRPAGRLVYLLLISLSLAVLPILAINYAQVPGVVIQWGSQLAFVAIALLPITYLYILVYHQPGDLELRVNQSITGLSYFVFIFLLSTTIVSASTFLSKVDLINPQAVLPVVAALNILLGVGAGILYPRYAAWVHKSVLGIAVLPKDLVAGYAAHITTSLDWKRLISILKDEILPGLLIRQAALMRLSSLPTDEKTTRQRVIFSFGVEPDLFPEREQLTALLQQSGRLRPDLNQDAQLGFPWVRVVLPLLVDGRIIGIFLFGRRDPDDYYSPPEIETLKAMMNQTALALVNIEQAENLRSLHQKDIERQESERNRLALELHDDVLGQLTLLPQTIGAGQVSPEFDRSYHETIQHVRNIIAGLRPSTLNYGLYTALEDLLENTAKNLGAALSNAPLLRMNVPSSQERFHTDVELHLFRIVQQALENSLKYAHASQVSLDGSIQAEQIELIVQDDGVGFAAADGLDLNDLLANKHFGLVGMQQRAALIGAVLEICSTPQHGTTVHVCWSKDNGQ